MSVGGTKNLELDRGVTKIGAEELSTKYFGRGIFFVPNGGVYFIEGRSDISKNRKLVPKLKRHYLDIATELVHDTSEGDASILLYTGMRADADKMVISNGNQTPYGWRLPFPAAFAKPHYFKGKDVTTHYEDDPNATPRITGKRAFKRNVCDLFRVRKADKSDKPEPSVFQRTLEPGVAVGLTTYSGEEGLPGSPLPAFTGNPWQLAVTSEDATALCEGMYNMLRRDIVVAVAAVTVSTLDDGHTVANVSIHNAGTDELLTSQVRLRRA